MYSAPASTDEFLTDSFLHSPPSPRLHGGKNRGDIFVEMKLLVLHMYLGIILQNS